MLLTFDVLANTANNAQPKTFTITVVKNDLVVSWEMVVEGQRFLPTDFNPSSGKWVRNFVNFPADGVLDVHLNAEGADSGVQVGAIAARVSLAGTALIPDIVVQTRKRFGTGSQTYNV